MIFGFIGRNLSYSVQNVRRLPQVIRAMKVYKAEHPHCAWCGRTKQVEVHHVEPVHFSPDKAGDQTNYISLCRKPACHQTIGHMGDFTKGYNLKVREACNVNAYNYSIPSMKE